MKSNASMELGFDYLRRKLSDKILFLNGEVDSYFAYDIRKAYTIEELVELAEDAQSQNTVCKFYDDEHGGGEVIGYVHVLEFGEVDPKFLKFLNQNELTIDYDMSKHRDFIVLE